MTKAIVKKFIPLSLLVFGTLYTLISDFAGAISRYFGDGNVLVIKFSICALILLLVVLHYVIERKIFTGILVKNLGFSGIEQNWLPDDEYYRTKQVRQTMDSFFAKTRSVLKLATITAEWDLIRTYSDSELKSLPFTKDSKLQILMIHPGSEFLNEHCNNENNDLKIMQEKIIRNTKKLLSIYQNKCEIRWHFTKPIFHLLTNENMMHLGYYPRSKKGHYSRKYMLTPSDDMFFTFNDWFDVEWANAVNASSDVSWIENSLSCDKAVFLDRDDTLVKDLGYTAFNDDLRIEILPGVIKGLQMLKSKGFRLIVISNQQAIGMDYINNEDLKKITKLFKSEFSKYAVAFDAIYYCTHTENDNCNCRKPKTQLLERAINRFSLKKEKSFFIGDSKSDMEIQNNMPDLKTYKIEDNFLEIVDKIIR